MLTDPARGFAQTRDAILPGPPAGGLPATTLAELLRSGPLAPSQAALIGFEAARLVERARRSGLTVRLDPTTVAVDLSARVHLVHTAPSGSTSSPVSTSAAWQAPEARDGRSLPGRSLVWSIGVLLRSMLAAPAPGSTSEVAATRLHAIARRATSTDPWQRQSSVCQIAREIGAVLLEDAPELA